MEEGTSCKVRAYQGRNPTGLLGSDEEAQEVQSKRLCPLMGIQRATRAEKGAHLEGTAINCIYEMLSGNSAIMLAQGDVPPAPRAEKQHQASRGTQGTHSRPPPPAPAR